MGCRGRQSSSSQRPNKKEICSAGLSTDSFNDLQFVFVYLILLHCQLKDFPWYSADVAKDKIAIQAIRGEYSPRLS